MKPSYYTPKSFLETSIEVKKSRFIARAAKVRDKAEAKTFIDQARRDFPDARHHCWAYLLGNPHAACSAAMNDDGEPGGTAGKPILNVIQHKHIGDIMVVVIRYFGGIKLGAGGLVRAYSSAAEAVVSGLALEEHRARVELQLYADFQQEQFVRHLLSGVNGEVLATHYGEGVEIHISIEEPHQASFLLECNQRGIRLKDAD
ncbi:MAG: YigZ family protein [Gammaproteobacteria bacterium]|nr:YigZ family protein [Gammaproteobacteria bacterium]